MPKPDTEDLAQRFLDLWQDHIAQLSADPQLAEAMSRLFTALAIPGMGIPGMGIPGMGGQGMGPAGFGPGGFGQPRAGGPGFGAGFNGVPPATPAAWADWMRGWMTGGAGDGGGAGQGSDGAGRRRGADDGASPRGAASADAAPVDGRELVDRLLNRLAQLEERMAALEGRGAGDGDRSVPGNGRSARRRAGGGRGG